MHFSQPLRVSRQGRGISYSDSDSKLSRKFLPMNRREPDEHVKVRSGNRSPDVGCSGNGKQEKDTLDKSLAEMWDAELPEKKEEHFTQSDEIGTTLLPELPQSPMLVIPPLVPPIMEQMPQMPLEKEPTQKDKRKLRIVESENESISSSKAESAKRQKVKDGVKLNDDDLDHDR